MKSKYTILGFLFLFGFILISKEFAKKKRSKDIERDSKEACISATNRVLGKYVDSVKTCDCLIPSFYEFLKGNPADVEKFNSSGLNDLDSSKKGTFASLYQSCIRENIIDTNAKIVFSPWLQDQFKTKLKDTILAQFGYIGDKRVSLICDCVVKGLDNRITVKQYLSSEFSEKDSAYQVIVNCINSSK